MDFATALRTGAAELHPTCTDHVRAAVEAANQQGWKLYPVSTDCNWGYGAELALPANVRKLKLDGMDHIRNRKALEDRKDRHAVAVVEPGVTQGKLHEFLSQHRPDLTFNVTGSARGTSLIGNALDRGVGYLGPRRDDLFDLEVVTGSGQLVRFGPGRLGEGTPLTGSDAHPAGPDLESLFFHSNFGVVVSAGFALKPRPPKQLAVSLGLLDTARLGDFIDVLADLKREGILGSVTHVGNQARTHVSLSHGVGQYLEQACGVTGPGLQEAIRRSLDRIAPNEWTALVGLMGLPGSVRAAVTEIKARMRGIAKVKTYDDAQLDRGQKLLHPLRFLGLPRALAAAIHAIRPLHGLATGAPTDAPIENLLWRFGANLPPERLSESRVGVVFINPLLPARGEFVVRFVRDMHAVVQAHGLTPQDLYITLNVETAHSLVAVVNLLFDRGDAVQTERAYRCADALYALIRQRDLEVYRARSDMMSQVVRPAEPYWQFVGALKACFDPNGVIAPGRYAPQEAHAMAPSPLVAL